MNSTLEGLLTAGSIVVVAVVAFFEFRKQRRDSQVQHTIDLIARSFDSGPVYDCRNELRTWIIAGRQVPDDKLSPEDDQVVATVLNYYDFLASLVKIDDMDLRVITGTLGGVIRRDFDYLKDYVGSRRRSSGRPHLYRNLEDMIEERLSGAE